MNPGQPGIPMAGDAAIGHATDLTLPLAMLIAGLVLSAFFAVAVTTLFPLFGVTAEQLSLKHKRRTRLEHLLQAPAATVMTVYLGSYFSRALVLLAAFAVAHQVIASDLTAMIAALIGGVSLLLLFGEILPRALAAKSSARTAARIARPIGMLMRVIYPVRRLSRLLGSDQSSKPVTRSVSDERLKAMVDRGEIEGLLGDAERETIDRVIEFGQSTAGEIMHPRTEIEGLPDTLTHEGLMEALSKTAHSRIPIYHESIDSIVGVLHAKEQLLNPETKYQRLLREPLFIPQSRALTDLLADFQRRRMHFAVVVDEYGGTSGAVALSDVLHEIISVFQEEEEESGPIRRVGENRWIVQGDCDIAELNDELSVDVPDTMSRTVGGFVTAVLGRFPRQQEAIVHSGLRFTVLRMEAHRVRLLRVQRPGETASGEEPDAVAPRERQEGEE